MRRLTHDMAVTQESLANLKNSITVNQKQTAEVVCSLREDVEQIQMHNKEVLSAFQQGVMESSRSLSDTLQESIATLKSEMEAMKSMISQSTIPGHSQSQRKQQ